MSDSPVVPRCPMCHSKHFLAQGWTSSYTATTPDGEIVSVKGAPAERARIKCYTCGWQGRLANKGDYDKA